jgi:hypothetical protein
VFEHLTRMKGVAVWRSRGSGGDQESLRIARIAEPGRNGPDRGFLAAVLFGGHVVFAAELE